MKRILAAIDFSDATDRVVDVAVDLARSTGGQIRLVHTEVPAPVLVAYDDAALPVYEAAGSSGLPDQDELNRLKHGVSDRGVPVESALIEGSPVESILQEAEAWEADLIVVGTHRHGKLFHLVFGSVHEGLIQRTPCPVLVVPPLSPSGED